MERTTNTIEKEPIENCESLEWLDHWIGHCYFRKKKIKANRFKIAYFCWKNLGPDVVQDFIWFTTELITEIMQDIVDMVKKKKKE